jgi:MFS family permease
MAGTSPAMTAEGVRRTGKARIRRAGALVALLCVTSVLGMLGSSSFAALLPEFQSLWSLDNTDAGWISGIYFAGYVAAVPLLVGSTDRVDPRRIYLWSLGIGCLASLGFALLAQGFWSAMALRALAGIGLAGTYMPGLKLLTDRTQGPRFSRYMAFYTGGFSLGTAASFAVSGAVAQRFGWQAAFLVAALGSALSILLLFLLVDPSPKPERVDGAALDFRPVFRNRAAMAFVLGYTGHTWELFALRAWLVTYLLFAARAAGASADIATASGFTTIIVLLSTATSIYGAELAARADRRRVIGRIMLVSVAAAALAGFSAGLPFPIVVALCLLYNLIVMGDSAALTAGAVIAATPGQRGVTLAVHSVMGFGGAFLGPLAIGAVLDLAGGQESHLAWGLAFLAMGAGSAASFVAVRRL